MTGFFQAVDKGRDCGVAAKNSNSSVQEVRVALEFLLRLALEPFSTACQIGFVSTLKEAGL
ncbi:MAG: hypothetical protein JEY79_08550 [Pseudodesulfovibrio sp.]|nr:hypothetical protein [Pseudodesulfovibrio sp.]